MRKTVYLVIMTVILAQTDTDFEPARLECGALSVETVQPPFTGGGQVLLELTVGTSGEVTGVAALRSTPPFTEHLANTVRGWQFAPARATCEESEVLVPIESGVLVAGLFRPPTTYDAPARGEVPEDVAWRPKRPRFRSRSGRHFIRCTPARIPATSLSWRSRSETTAKLLPAESFARRRASMRSRSRPRAYGSSVRPATKEGRFHRASISCSASVSPSLRRFVGRRPLGLRGRLPAAQHSSPSRGIH